MTTTAAGVRMRGEEQRGQIRGEVGPQPVEAPGARPRRRRHDAAASSRGRQRGDGRSTLLGRDRRSPRVAPRWLSRPCSHARARERSTAPTGSQIGQPSAPPCGCGIGDDAGDDAAPAPPPRRWCTPRMTHTAAHRGDQETPHRRRGPPQPRIDRRTRGLVRTGASTVRWSAGIRVGRDPLPEHPVRPAPGSRSPAARRSATPTS